MKIRHLHKQLESQEAWAELGGCNDGKTRSQITNQWNGNGGHSRALSLFLSLSLRERQPARQTD